MGLLDGLFGSGGASSNQAALDEIRNIPLPVLKEYYPELYKQVAELNPETETAVNLGASEMGGISTDPAARQSPLNALGKLGEIGQAGGRDAQFMADQGQLESDINTNLRGQQGATMQNLAARGLSGGGTELVARQMNAQNASNQQANTAMQAKAQAEQRALQALMQSGQLGGQMQQQDFSQASAKAQAADNINKFNAQNQQGVMSNNVNTRNQAQASNVAAKQGIANQNTGLGNEAQQYNLNLAQRNYDNAMGRATGVANQYNNIAAGKDKERAADQALVGNIIGAGASAYAGGKK